MDVKYSYNIVGSQTSYSDFHADRNNADSVAMARSGRSCISRSSAGQPNNRYTATATIYWTVRWTAAGAPGGGNLGEIPGDTTSTSVEVDEIQAINTASR